ncbi:MULTISPECIES: SDR family oxidoreductase [Shouchella]|uniref:SDR family oxidoreductase n=1 Tax=Shouchella rhizosphaerae TaxID=866786 RepID=A0ABZ2CQZ6_9BACI|nr:MULTISPECIES: SDR family oxidoreductase [Shouchella]MBX0317368.1 SDR family oxidoreductase [Shouchella clausii]MCM3379517.1 SDR family oxidoreductase [Shouchella rhizosphaerae]PAD16207.1 LPS biosynthesis protein WbpP [Shouchella clausii]PAE81948.1 LPS biosynthesis protein WbpP [Shouchella clausii]PAF09035.1 LPS biosynthesis protein WbpP [Shouchella clausii]
MATYLITGGAGFIGSNIAKALVAKGEKVKILDNFNTGKKDNIAEFIDEIEVIDGDFTNEKTVQSALKQVDVVFHQGAIPSVPKSIQNPIESNHANVSGTLQLLQGAVEARVSRFIYAASSSAYGDSETLPKHEQLPGNPMSPYAVSKYTGELYCKVFYNLYGLETVSLRYFNVFGPRQDPNSKYAAVIPSFIKAMLNDKPPTIFGDGTQSRDFTFIDNVVAANLLAANAPKLQGESVNIGGGASIDLNSLVDEINVLLGKQIQANYGSERPGDVKHSLADIHLAEKLIAYRPTVSFQEGLRQTVEWFKHH